MAEDVTGVQKYICRCGSCNHQSLAFSVYVVQGKCICLQQIIIHCSIIWILFTRSRDLRLSLSTMILSPKYMYGHDAVNVALVISEITPSTIYPYAKGSSLIYYLRKQLSQTNINIPLLRSSYGERYIKPFKSWRCFILQSYICCRSMNSAIVSKLSVCLRTLRYATLFIYISMCHAE